MPGGALFAPNEGLHVKRISTLVFLAALLSWLPWISPAGAQASRPAANLSLAQAERMAADLKQGMSAEEVERLLGKPRRTSLKKNGFSTSEAQGTLQWTYTWAGSSSSQSSLHVEFAAKTPEAWYVNSWEWATY
jgi:hypothetical protein